MNGDYCRCEDQTACRRIGQFRCTLCGKVFDPATYPHKILASEVATDPNLEIVRLRARIAQLESYLPKTKDGKLIAECEVLYCPECGKVVRQCGTVCYCEECPNPDDGNEPPLPLFETSCLSYADEMASARSVLKECLETIVGVPLKFDPPGLPK